MDKYTSWVGQGPCDVDSQCLAVLQNPVPVLFWFFDRLDNTITFFLMIPGGYFLGAFQIPTGYCREGSKNNLAGISFSKMSRGFFCAP